MLHHCNIHLELWPEYWRHIYVVCKEEDSGRFSLYIGGNDLPEVKEAVVVNYCPICGAESPAHKAEQGVFDAHPFIGIVEYPEVKHAVPH